MTVRLTVTDEQALLAEVMAVSGDRPGVAQVYAAVDDAEFRRALVVLAPRMIQPLPGTEAWLAECRFD